MSAADTDGTAAPPLLPAGAALPAEDAKLVTMARGAMGRAGTTSGAAVRDDDGRTYAAATVTLPSLRLTALQAAVAIAVASGAGELEAAVIVGAPELDADSLAASRDMSTGVVLLADASGVVLQRITP
ncbi:hypothetical protein ABIB25_000902 [Nakamurella sp. UYEF19]|uniref:cytidine deaminase n=1 Tax=Nakamurella sp. UYEF19 TaxID=1756392 RepID=UPI00339B0C4B